MKKQVNYNGSLFDAIIDEQNNLTLNKVKIKNKYCRQPKHCPSNKGNRKKWKVELYTKYSVPFLGTHIGYCETEKEAIALVILTENRLKELYPNNRKLKN